MHIKYIRTVATNILSSILSMASVIKNNYKETEKLYNLFNWLLQVDFI